MDWIFDGFLRKYKGAATRAAQRTIGPFLTRSDSYMLEQWMLAVNVRFSCHALYRGSCCGPFKRIPCDFAFITIRDLILRKYKVKTADVKFCAILRSSHRGNSTWFRIFLNNIKFCPCLMLIYLVYKTTMTKWLDFQLLWFVQVVLRDYCLRQMVMSPWQKDECLGAK